MYRFAIAEICCIWPAIHESNGCFAIAKMCHIWPAIHEFHECFECICSEICYKTCCTSLLLKFVIYGFSSLINLVFFRIHLQEILNRKCMIYQHQEVKLKQCKREM